MTLALMLALVSIGVAGPIAHASHGWPRTLRVRMMRLGPSGRQGRAWRHLFGCAMCLSFWIGAAIGVAISITLRDPHPLMTPAASSGIVWIAITIGRA